MSWFLDFYLNSPKVLRHVHGNDSGKNIKFHKHNWERVEGVNKQYGRVYRCKDCGVNLTCARGRMFVTGQKIYAKHAMITSSGKCKTIKKAMDAGPPKPPQPGHRWKPFYAARNGKNSQLCKRCGQVIHLLDPRASGTEFPKYRWSKNMQKYVKPDKCCVNG